MNSHIVKLRLLERGEKLIDLARKSAIAYDRLVRVVHGFRQPTDSEIDLIAQLLDLDPAELRGNRAASIPDEPEAA